MNKNDFSPAPNWILKLMIVCVVLIAILLFLKGNGILFENNIWR